MFVFFLLVVPVEEMGLCDQQFGFQFELSFHAEDGGLCGGRHTLTFGVTDYGEGVSFFVVPCALQCRVKCGIKIHDGILLVGLLIYIYRHTRN